MEHLANDGAGDSESDGPLGHQARLAQHGDEGDGSVHGHEPLRGELVHVRPPDSCAGTINADRVTTLARQPASFRWDQYLVRRWMCCHARCDCSRARTQQCGLAHQSFTPIPDGCRSCDMSPQLHCNSVKSASGASVTLQFAVVKQRYAVTRHSVRDIAQRHHTRTPDDLRASLT